MKTEGAELLTLWRESQEPRLSKSELARLLKCSPAHVSNIESGEDRPSGDLAFRIQSVTGGRVPAASFFENREVA
jgi:transcriptional regulator with XRE-family HTH domain